MRKKSFVAVLFAMFLSVLILYNGQLVYANESDYEWADNMDEAGNPDGTVTITDYVGTSKDVEIPETLGGKIVTSIGDSAFLDNPLMDVTLTSKISYSLFSASFLPRKEGHVFDRWYTDSEHTIEWDKKPADATLYAKWIINEYIVTFDSQGGRAVPDVVADYATNINTPTPPTRSGRRFVGWYTDADLTTPWNFSADTVQSDMTLYAKCQVKPTPPPLDIQATMTANQALIEEQLNGSKLIVNVSDTSFMMSLTPEHFEL